MKGRTQQFFCTQPLPHLDRIMLQQTSGNDDDTRLNQHRNGNFKKPDRQATQFGQRTNGIHGNVLVDWICICWDNCDCCIDSWRFCSKTETDVHGKNYMNITVSHNISDNNVVQTTK